MKLVVGLRNPGPEYEGTRHNVGAEVLAELARRHGGRFKRGPVRVRCELADIRVDSERLLLVAPLSYMNESGGPVKGLLDFYKVPIEHLVIVHEQQRLRIGGAQRAVSQQPEQTGDRKKARAHGWDFALAGAGAAGFRAYATKCATGTVQLFPLPSSSRKTRLVSRN